MSKSGFSEVALNTQESKIRAFLDFATGMTKEGYDLIISAMGNPQKRATPEGVEAALTHWIEIHGAYYSGQFGSIIDEMISTAGLPSGIKSKADGYGPFQGLPEVREGLAGFYNRDLSGRGPERKFTANDIMLANGGNDALTLSILSLSNPGDKVVTFGPYFAQYKAKMELLGRSLDVLDTKNNPSPYKPDSKQLEDYLKENPGTTLLINYPNNPTGVTLNREELEPIMKIAEKYGSPVISDNIYKNTAFNQDPVDVFDVIGKDYSNIVVTINASTKAHGMTGRAADIIAPDVLPNGLTLAQAMGNIQASLATGVNQAAQKFHLKAQLALPRVREENAIYYGDRINAVFDPLKDAGLTGSLPKPGGAFYMIADLSMMTGVEITPRTAQFFNIQGVKKIGDKDGPIAVIDTAARTGVLGVPFIAFGGDAMGARIVVEGDLGRVKQIPERLINLKKGIEQGNVPDSPPKMEKGVGIIVNEQLKDAGKTIGDQDVKTR